MNTGGCAHVAYLEKYKANKPGLAAVKELADRFMADFDAQEEEVWYQMFCMRHSRSSC